MPVTSTMKDSSTRNCAGVKRMIMMFAKGWGRWYFLVEKQETRKLGDLEGNGEK